MDAVSSHYYGDFMAPRKAEEWNKCITGLIQQINQDLSLLYKDVEETIDPQVTTGHKSSDVNDGVPFPTLVETFVKNCDSLCLLLRTPTKWPVKLPMNSVVKVLTRCLRVTAADLKFKPSLWELSDALPNLHGSALLALTQLINCCGSNVMPLSRTLVDASFRCLSGAKQAKDDFKSQTRGKSFELLSLLVKRFGWGRHFQSISSLLIQEMIADICSQDATKTTSSVNSTKPKLEVESIAQRKSKKKKKGNKLKGDSYSDLPVCAAGDQGAAQTELYNVEATQAALELSSLVIQKSDFSHMKTLVQSLLGVCKKLQREGLSASSSYNWESCREKLYHAVFSCAMVRLGYDCDRKDTIGHYQVTNLAICLLTSAAHSDSSLQIQETCKKFLELIRSTGNLNKPIVRRVLPEEQMSTNDITEVEGEAERLREENKRLWKQLVDTQLEAETRGRELEKVQASLKHAETKLHDLKSTPENHDKSHKENVTNEDDMEEEACFNEEESTPFEDEANSEVRDKISAKPDYEKESKQHTSLNSSESPSIEMPTKEKMKRALDDADIKQKPKKKPKTTEDIPIDSDEVHAMLLDFVDAVPDEDR